MKARPFYLSAQFWINMIALVVFIVQFWVKDFVIPVEVQAAILVLIEVILSLILKEDVVLTKSKAELLNKKRGLK